MIDCHVHAFPELDEQVQRLPAAVSELAGDDLVSRWSRASQRLYGGLARTFGGSLSVEAIARMRRSGRGALPRAAEVAMNVASVPQILFRGTLHDLGTSMDRAGISKVVLIASRPLATNAWLARATATSPSPQRYVTVAHPPEVGVTGSEQMWLDGYAQLADQGFSGFKIHPNLDGFEPGHTAYRALFEVAKARRMFVILHTGCFTVVGYKSQRPANSLAFTDLFRQYPGVRVCLAHMHRDHPQVAWEVMRHFEHVWTDTSWQPARAIEQAVNEIGSDRLLLGSDWPLLHGEIQVEAVDVLRRAVDEQRALQIGEHNAEAFLAG